MDILNVQPDALGVSDTTQEIEGYDDRIEEIEQAYPEEDFRTPAEKAAQEQVEQPQEQQPQAEAQPQPTVEDVANQVGEQLGIQQGPPPEQVEADKAAEKEQARLERTKHIRQRQYGEDGLATSESILIWDGTRLDQLPNGAEMIDKIKLRHDYNPELEKRVIELMSGQNLENHLEAFNLIRNDPHLSDVLDYNGDGQVTYNDFHDTTHLNDGDGMTAEEDAIATQEWIEGLTNPDVGSRLRALYQQVGPGQNMALKVLKMREGYFDPSWEEDTRQAGGGAWFDIGADFLETVGSVGDVMQGKSWHEDSTFDDDLLQHKNTESLEFLVNNPLQNTKYSKDIYDGTYWVTAGALTYASGGLLAKPLLASKVGMGTVTAGKVLQGAMASGPGSIVLDTLAVGHFRDYQIHGVGMMRKNGLLTGLTDMMGGAGEVFGPEVANAINSPTFKKYDHVYTEGALALAGTWVFGMLGRRIFGSTGSLRAGIRNMSEQGGNYIETFATSTKPNSVKDRLLSQEKFFQQAQQQTADMLEAGREQMKKGYEFSRNAFSRLGDPESSTYGWAKNGSDMIGQGWSKARSGIHQVIRDLDEIAHSVGIPKAWQSTDGLFSQVDLAKAAKAGISDNKLARWGKELVEDVQWKKHLKELNPLRKATRREASDTALRGIQEVMGRDAARLDPSEYWGKQLLDTPLDADSFEKLSDFDKWAINNIEVANGVNKQLLLQLRDSAATAGEMVGKTDLFATDGAMRRIADNLVAGLSHVKKTNLTHKLAREMLQANNGKMTPDMMVELLTQTGEQSRRLHSETQKGVETMLEMMRQSGDDDLAEAVLDVFKVSNDVHNWKDFDAWMHQKIVGGEFKGKVKTGDLIKGLQKVMVQSILSGPKTPARALVGTTTNTYLNAINEAVGAIIREPFTGDVVSRKASVAKLKGLFELIPEGWEVFQRNWDANFRADIADIKTRYTEAATKGDDLWEAKRIHVENRGTAGEKAAFYINNITRNLTNNKLFSWSPRALAATDDTFLWLSARARSKEVGMRQALEAVGGDFNKLTPDILKQAEDIHYSHFLDADGNINIGDDAWLTKQFKEVTLTSELKGQAAKLDKVFSEIPLIKPFYLFARTGINGLNFTYKNTPLLGALHKESIDILRHTGDDFTELAQYGINNANDLKNARNLFAGRQAVGATVVSGMGAMYMAGQLTGNGPADKQLRQSWINAGWKPNHVYVGDVGFDYRTLEPYNIIFSTIADIGDNIELMGSEWAEKRLQAVAFVVGRGVTGKTYMSGLDQLMQIAQMKPGAFDKAAANVLNNSIPLAGMRNEIGKWINPHMKELNSDMISSIRNRNLASEGLSGQPLPEKADMLNGKPINNWNIVGRSFNAVSPIGLDIRRDTPGRRLLLNSNYDLKSTTYAYGGYSFVKDANVRAAFQKEIGSTPVTVGFKNFNNVEEALDHLATRDDVKNSMKDMQRDSQNPSNWDLDPNTYPHNTLIDNLMNQARAKAWAKMQRPDHPAYRYVKRLKTEKDGLTSRQRENRQQILEFNYPSRQVEQFPKN